MLQNVKSSCVFIALVPSQKNECRIKQKAPTLAVPFILGIFKIVLCAGKILTDELRTLVKDLLYLLLAHS